MQATVRIEVRGRDQTLLAVREAKNAVMRAGAELIADLFTGSGTPISHMGVGTSDVPESDAFATTSLSNAADDPLQGETEAELAAEAFDEPEVDEINRVVRVRVRGTLPDAAAVRTVREAGLLARSAPDSAVLYNRVTFAPIDKRDDHELTLFWEITFPYGDLHFS